MNSQMFIKLYLLLLSKSNLKCTPLEYIYLFFGIAFNLCVYNKRNKSQILNNSFFSLFNHNISKGSYFTTTSSF